MGGLPANQTVNGFAVEPQNPKVMYVTVRDGVFKSSDAGMTWKAVGKELKNMAAVTVNPRMTSEIYASTADGVIFKSGDGGMNWRRP